jgi:putative transposase
MWTDAHIAVRKSTHLLQGEAHCDSFSSQAARDYFVRVLRARSVHWTKPFTSSMPLGTLADLGRGKAELVAENVFLRQQLMILERQVKRPACTKTDRILLVLFARAVQAWKQALFLVQPETLLALTS